MVKKVFMDSEGNTITADIPGLGVLPAQEPGEQEGLPQEAPAAPAA
jgi:hypothetical protein